MGSRAARDAVVRNMGNRGTTAQRRVARLMARGRVRDPAAAAAGVAAGFAPAPIALDGSAGPMTGAAVYTPAVGGGPKRRK